MKIPMWKPVAWLLALTAVPSLLLADTRIGIGASLQQSFDSISTIYIPVKTENYLFEPSVSYTSLDEGIGEFKQSRFIVGMYRYFNHRAETSFYYGAKVGYTSIEDRFSGIRDKASGFYVAPTLGAEYAFSQDFSIGVDLSLVYVDIKNESEDDSSNEFDTSESSTVADVVLRYMF